MRAFLQALCGQFEQERPPPVTPGGVPGPHTPKECHSTPPPRTLALARLGWFLGWGCAFIRKPMAVGGGGGHGHAGLPPGDGAQASGGPVKETPAGASTGRTAQGCPYWSPTPAFVGPGPRAKLRRRPPTPPPTPPLGPPLSAPPSRLPPPPPRPRAAQTGPKKLQSFG